MTTLTGNVLRPMGFAKLVSNKALKDYGFTSGDEVLVLAFKSVQDNPDDPYSLRNYAVVARLVDGEFQIPDENNDYKVYTVDPRNFEGADDERTKQLEELIRKQYG